MAYNTDQMLTRPTPTLPSPSAPDFLEKVKTLLDLREGHTRDQDERFVTIRQLKAMGSGNSVGGVVIIGGGGSSTPGGGTDSTPPSPPTNLNIQNDTLTHTLTWTNPAESDFSHIEIWRSLVQDRTQAQCVGIATKPTETITLNGVSPRLNYYYWIRAIDQSGNYSIWTPNNLMGGELIAGEFAQSINATLTDLFDDDRYMTNHTIVADSFKIIQPNAGLTEGKAVFAVGNINGTPSVGIIGNLIIDGTILGDALHAESVTADKIGANAITAVKVAANAINGDHIQAQSSIKLNEGGKLTVGNNNVVLDSIDDQIIVAPDNGTIIGTPEYDGVDYCSLKDGNISFMYWDGGRHQLYNSLKRVEMGMSIPNNVRVTIPGIWKAQPKIIVSPADIMTYNRYHNANQNLVCTAEDIQKSGLTYSFTPRAYLRLTDGLTGLPISLSARANGTGWWENDWHWANTASRTTPLNTTTLTLNGTLYGGCWRKYYNMGGYYDRATFYVRVWVNIDGVDYWCEEWSARGDGLLSKTFTKTVSGLASGAHNYYLKIAYMHGDVNGYGTTYDYVLHGQIDVTNETTNQSTFTTLANGTLNYMAVGE